MCKETRDLDPEKHRGSVTVKIMVFILKKNLGIVTQDTDSDNVITHRGLFPVKTTFTLFIFILLSVTLRSHLLCS